MSMSASGQLAKTIVFSHWKGRPYVRTLVKPSNPKSGPQKSVRAMLKNLSQRWAALSTANKATWQTPADVATVSPFNAYVSYNLTRWSHFKSPSNVYPAAEAAAAPTAPTTTATAGVREITLSMADGATPPTWGWMIFASTTTGFTPSFSNLIAVVTRTATPTVYINKPLVTGVPMYFRIKGATIDGVTGTLEVERTATPT